ncbi:agip39 [Agrotis ipsilon multiple nucleopolyhedrovirus]|uniref:Uncharacterized protein n=1 Tax=Agrotis ipsilon multiple nucleopolyhedrovirus TaxID=208013 RepID=B6D5V3_9ABAC|nr:agip39 [Agrotis ipsilon multiple nucleopolyhedrovirus]ACI28741.1 unknown [Agrotis ipsilon multiple nucleopolyhedrovirus]
MEPKQECNILIKSKTPVKMALKRMRNAPRKSQRVSCPSTLGAREMFALEICSPYLRNAVDAYNLAAVCGSGLPGVDSQPPIMERIPDDSVLDRLHELDGAWWCDEVAYNFEHVFKKKYELQTSALNYFSSRLYCAGMMKRCAEIVMLLRFMLSSEMRYFDRYCKIYPNAKLCDDEGSIVRVDVYRHHHDAFAVRYQTRVKISDPTEESDYPGPGSELYINDYEDVKTFFGNKSTEKHFDAIVVSVYPDELFVFCESATFHREYKQLWHEHGLTKRRRYGEYVVYHNRLGYHFDFNRYFEEIVCRYAMLDVVPDETLRLPVRPLSYDSCKCKKVLGSCKCKKVAGEQLWQEYYVN